MNERQVDMRPTTGGSHENALYLKGRKEALAQDILRLKARQRAAKLLDPGKPCPVCGAVSGNILIDIPGNRVMCILCGVSRDWRRK